MRRILFFLLFPLQVAAQFTYTIDQSIPVIVSDKVLLNPWAGGLNSTQINKMDLNADGEEDLVIYDNTTSKLNIFIADHGKYVYSPQYETLFPSDISTYAVLKDYNCDGKKDLFTFGQIGIYVYQNITPPGGTLTWKKLRFLNSTSGLKSDVLLTLGLSGMVNLLPGTNDLPDFVDMDGDGDLDVLNMRFVTPSSAEYHKNFSMERYGICDSLALERQTQNWGGFEECSCGRMAFGQTCADIGGRVEHTGGKALLTYDFDNDGDKDLLFSEESCNSIFYLENHGTSSNAVMTNEVPFPSSTPINILFPATYMEDMDFDGKLDLIASTNLYARNDLSNNFQQSIWFYKNTGTNQLPVFSFVKNDFLQEDMIDVGDFSSPSFVDYDQDGDPDMFISQYAGGASAATISLYQNTGSSTAPAFKLVNQDFYGFSLLNYSNLKIQFIDVDRNGGSDLVFTATNILNGRTSLYYVLNGSNSSIPSGGTIQVVSGITLDATESATMIDVDLDGRTDILIGRANGSLEYWRNNGGMTFVLSNSKYLGLDSTPLRQSISVFSADLDADGKDDLMVGDQKGVITIYSDFRSGSSQPQNSIVYDSFSKSYTSRRLGGKLRPVAVNLRGTDKPDIVTGNTQGGIYILKNENGQVTNEKPVITLFPNPVENGQPIGVRSDRQVVMQLFTTLGQPIGTPQLIPANEIINFPFQNISSGVYIARFTSGSKFTAVRFVIK